jgi:hypothetical protein
MKSRFWHYKIDQTFGLVGRRAIALLWKSTISPTIETGNDGTIPTKPETAS